VEEIRFTTDLQPQNEDISIAPDKKLKTDDSEKLHNLMYNNQDKSMDEVKKNFLKFNEEEDFLTKQPGQAEKDSKSKDSQNAFLSILRIGLVNVLKIDSQTADLLLGYIESSMNKKTQVKVPLSVVSKDPKKDLDLPQKHHKAIKSILQKHYMKNPELCQEQLDKYAFDNNLPEMKVVIDMDIPVEKPVTLKSVINDALSKLSKKKTVKG